MKHTLFSCAKYKRLRNWFPGYPECAIVGALEMLFQFGNANGDVLNKGDVEVVCGWGVSEPGELLAALTDTGDGVYTNFLDVMPDGKHVQIHDFYEHAPECVKSRKRVQEHRERRKLQREQDTVTEHNSNVTVTACNVTSHYSNDKRNETKRNEYIDSNESTAEPRGEQEFHIDERDERDGEVAKAGKGGGGESPVPVPGVQGKLKGTSKADWKAKASSTHLFTAFNAYPATEWRGNPKDCQAAWDAAAEEVGGYDALLTKVLDHLARWDRSKVPRFTKYLEEGWFNGMTKASNGKSKVTNERKEERII